MAHLTQRRTDRLGPAPLIMIVDGGEWPARALESILLPAGFRVHRAHSAEQGLREAVLHAPDAMLIDIGPAGSGIELCRRLAASPQVGPGTPIILTTSDPTARRQRVEALHAGAWEFLLLPAAVDELLARLETWVRAKRAIDLAREESLLDPETGFYNARGLQQRAAELAAEAVRFRRPLSCVVFTLDPDARPGLRAALGFVDEVRSALQRTVRTCDAVGRLSSHQFAVLAPATDTRGAQRLAERVLAALDLGTPAGAGWFESSVHAGHYGVLDLSDTLLEPGELLDRAAAADRTVSHQGDIHIRVRGRAVLV